MALERVRPPKPSVPSGHQRRAVEDLPGKGIEHAHVLQGFSPSVSTSTCWHWGWAKPLGGGAAELPLVLGQLPEGELVIFAHQLAQGAGDFKAVGAGSVAGGGDEHAGRAVRIFQMAVTSSSTSMSCHLP